MIWSILAHLLAKFFNIHGGIWSGPAALFGFKFRICFSIPAVVNTMSPISGKGDVPLFGMFAVSSFGKTDWKCLYVGFVFVGMNYVVLNFQRGYADGISSTKLDIYLLLTEFEVRTVSYGPSFFFVRLWPKREARGP